MKTLITSLIIAGGALLPATQIHAAPASQSVSAASKAKTYGDFAVGQKFTLTVTEALAVKGGLTGTPKKTSIPSGVPKFKKGQKVKFTIGSKGELKGPGFTIKFESPSALANAYINKPKKGSTALNADAAVVRKNSLKKPVFAELSFFKTTGSGLKTTVYSVTYLLE
ncbi:hypothetical protein JIN84_10855 [Luteolibacter yonseiensis]|uniref:DUF4402 domain-containing protein n=1 Tax=Luteolibacter yonseiensis TaxID=1144680 RepID=A0A934V7G4_9BACT|nr:hypothetical protein [Luteolibacter yonseiensis]MBK1816112.1 hypothetical protein [Luteolibacter yonseiensis]